MSTRKYKTDKNQLLAEDQMIVSSTDDAKYQDKVEMVNLVLGGMTPSALSQYVSESKNTIIMWVKSVVKKAYHLIQEEKLEEYSDIRNKKILVKLLPYSPDLNPIE